jgi:hypothetical protein
MRNDNIKRLYHVIIKSLNVLDKKESGGGSGDWTINGVTKKPQSP